MVKKDRSTINQARDIPKDRPKADCFWESTCGRRLLYVLWIPIIALLNYVAVQVAIFLKIPFFLDTWATTLGVMAGGLAVGLAGGVLYNLVMMTVWGADAWVWAFANIWVALSVFFLYKKGWIDIRKPGKLFISALLVGLTESIVVIIILFSAWGGMETYEGVLPTYDAILDATGSRTFAAIGEKFVTIPIDQMVSIFIAAIIFSSLPKRFIFSKRKKSSEEG